MNFYQAWYALAAHWFNGVTQPLVLELFSVTATVLTMIGLALVPMCWIGGKK